MSSPWSITFGDYTLVVDRRTLTFTLTETKTGTVWADGLSLGWLDVRERETGVITRRAFDALRQVSVSEKAGPQGKRILFGLDCSGIPVDLYLICSLREIQIQVEANRDSRTHLVEGFGLVPGLCAVPDDTHSYLVIPHGEGAIQFARNAKPLPLPIWDSEQGVNMPFVGAVKTGSALALITDSAYGLFRLARTENGATLDPEYKYDPERRRLDLRIVPLPGGDAIKIARTYREKLIGDNNHLTLRKKMRERPALSTIGKAPFPANRTHLPVNTMHLTDIPEGESRWEAMEQKLQEIAGMAQPDALITALGGSDWACMALDAVIHTPSSLRFSRSVPLYAAVYRDCVVPLASITDMQDFLTGLSRLCAIDTPDLEVTSPPGVPPGSLPFLAQTYRDTFSAFLTGHRFLTPDFTVEETTFSDKTRVIINRSETQAYQTDKLNLPPLGYAVQSRYQLGRESVGDFVSGPDCLQADTR